MERQVTPNAVTTAKGEGLVNISSVVVEGRSRIIVFLRQPALWPERLWIMEVEWRVISRELVHTNTSLELLVNLTASVDSNETYCRWY